MVESTWTTEGISAYFVLFSALLTLVLVLCKILHDHKVLAAILPEAGLIILVGLLAGGLVHWLVPVRQDNDVAGSLLGFSNQVFFIALLPPIIFNSGYHLRRDIFFRHIVPIVLFAAIGTLVSAFAITTILQVANRNGWLGGFQPTLTELFCLGALLSATDPVSTLAVFSIKRVDPHLFYLVFGESVLNDAVGLVLFESTARFVVRRVDGEQILEGIGEFILGFMLDAAGSPLLGLASAVFAGLLFKHVDFREQRLVELAIYVLIMYTPFLLAEVLQLSGIVTILFTGMAARNYVVPNLSPWTAKNADTLFRLASHLAETSIFLELGLSVFGLTGSFNGRFILWTMIACLVGRACHVYPITLLYNQSLRVVDKVHCGDETTVGTPRVRRRHMQQSVELTEIIKEHDHHRPALPHQLQRSDSDVMTIATLTPHKERDLKIHWNTAHMLWFSGLRGAVAYACVRSFPDTFGHSKAFVVTTMMVVLMTVFVLGSTTECVLGLLKIETNVDEEKYLEEWHSTSASWLLRVDDWMKHYVVRQENEAEKNLMHSTESFPMPSIEMTASQHFTNVTHRRKKGSVYDYGGGDVAGDDD